MPRLLARALAAAGLAILTVLALVGVAVSALVAASSVPAGRRAAAALVTRELRGAFAGRVAVDEVALLPRGVELRGVRIDDPSGERVVAVARLRALVELPPLTRRRARVLVDVSAPSVMLRAEADGGLSIARAFAPARPSPPEPPTPAPGPPRAGWAIDVARLSVRDGELRWVRADGATGAAATGLALDAEGAVDGAGVTARVRLRGAAEAPVAGPLAVDASARIAGGRLEVTALDASIGATALALAGALDLRTAAFRAAVRLGLAAAHARWLLPAVAPAGDVGATGYAASDGSLLTAALVVRPSGGGSGGRAEVAAALRLGPAPAIGFDVALRDLDPSRVLAQAPPARLTVTARGAAEGHDLADGRGWLALDVAPSRLRGADVGPIALALRAAGGAIDLDRLDARLPGLTVTGSGRWRPGGAVRGEVALDANDLARLARAVAAATGLRLPAVEGRLRARATLAGTAAAPALTAAVDAPHLRVGPARTEGLRLALDGAAPLAAARGQLVASVRSAAVSGRRARGIALSAALRGDEARAALAAILPDVGPDPFTLDATARLAPDRRRAAVNALSVGWPGARVALTRPATIAFAPLAVDRLELAAGPRALAISGGLRPRGQVDARLEVVRLDVARVPAGLLPPRAGLRGELSLDARASGPARAPTVAARVAWTGAAIRGLDGLELRGDLRWGRARLDADVTLRRGAGGALHAVAGLPLPLAGAHAQEPVALTVDASGWPVEALRAALGVAAPVKGTLAARVALSGSVGAPALTASAALEDAALGDLGPLAAAVALEQARGAASATVSARLAGAPVLAATAQVPLDLAEVLRRPGAAARALARAPFTAAAEVPGLDLAVVSGKAGLPGGLAGTVRGRVALRGTLDAPRGEGTLALAGGVAAGYRDLAAHAELSATAERTRCTVRASIGGAEALRADAALDLPPERLLEAAALRAARLAVAAEVPRLSLPQSGASALLTGTVSAQLEAQGTLAAPRGRLALAGQDLAFHGRTLGALAAVARHDGATTAAEVTLRPATGGTLRLTATLAAPLGLGMRAAALLQAHATARATTQDLELGFLPAATGGAVRSASGRLRLDLAASGPLATLRPRGAVALAGGQLTIAGLAPWTDVALEASLGDDVVEVRTLSARRGAGQLSATLAVRGLESRVARVEGELTLRQLTILRAGTPLATLDFPVKVEGTLDDARLDATLTIPGGTIRLPRKPPNTLQSLEGRPDVVEVEAAQADAAPAALPRAVRVRLLVPGKLMVKSERPAMSLELTGDSTWRVDGGKLAVEGGIEAVRGTVEPLAGRVFQLTRGKVTFTGGALDDALLDVLARYDNPAAVVTVAIGGTVQKPTLQLSSVPAMDDAQIAMLIATGRTDINLNTGGTDTLTTKEAGQAMAGAAASAAFATLVSGKLPVDQLSIDSSRVRAGKYLSDKLFVGYTYQFDAKPEEGENLNEVKAEYQISRRWRFEVRYGDAPAGDASLIWAKDY